MNEGLITLTAEGGTEEQYELMDVITYMYEVYVVAGEVDNEDGNVTILRVVDEDNYESVEDEDILNEVFELFKEKNKNDYIFED